MNRFDNIYLIGLMGAGKTTIGRQLARALDMPFYDSDKAIEDKTGVDIPTIFEFEGEEGFRNREQKMIEQLSGLNGVVLATGGGVVLREQNRELLKTNGFVVYLQCSVDRILQRTRRDKQRPLLQTENPRERIKLLLEQRETLYLSCSDYKVDTGKMQSKEAVKRIIKQFRLVNNAND